MESFSNETETISLSAKTNQRLGALESAIDTVDERVTSINASTQIQISTLQEADSSLSDSLSSYQTEVATFDSRINTVADAESALKTELEDYIEANEESVTTAKLNADVVNAPTVNATTEFITPKATIESATITDLNVTNLNAPDTVNTEYLQATDSIDTDILNARLVKATQSVDTPEINIEKIKSVKEYTDSGYESSEYVAHYTIKPHSSNFVMYSTDSSNQWSIAWNGAICYNEPKAELQYVTISQTEQNGTILDLYIAHPNEELKYNLITLGDDDIEIEAETVKIPYDKQNITQTNGVYPSSEADMSVSIKFVSILPDEPVASTIYVIENNGSFVWNADTNSWVKLNPFYLDTNTEEYDPIYIDFDEDTATFTANAYYASTSDFDLSFIRV